MRALPALFGSDHRRGREAREQGDGEKDKFDRVRCEDRCHGTFPYSQNGVGTDGASYAKRMPRTCMGNTFAFFVKIVRLARKLSVCDGGVPACLYREDRKAGRNFLETARKGPAMEV